MIYLDSAATTLQKPSAVARAMAEAVGAMTSPGRGNYGPSSRASRTLLALREKAAELFGMSRPEQVILTHNATHGLNLAVKTMVRPGARVLLSGWEHNAVTRPLATIPGVRARTVEAPLFQPKQFLEDLDRKLKEGTDGVICTHVSNVFGYILPVGEIAARCWAASVPLLVDASQSAGVLPISMDEWGADFVAMPGHKGLLGPMGTGLLLLGDQMLPRPLREGGTGSASESLRQPTMLPDRLESGTANLPGIAGLVQGLKFVLSHRAAIAEYEYVLSEQLRRGLEQIPGVTLYAGPAGLPHVGVVSFNLRGMDSGEAADRLNRAGIAVRGGLHCAPSIHAWLGTTGAVRASVGPFNTERDVDALVDAARKIQKGQL